VLNCERKSIMTVGSFSGYRLSQGYSPGATGFSRKTDNQNLVFAPRRIKI